MGEPYVIKNLYDRSENKKKKRILYIQASDTQAS